MDKTNTYRISKKLGEDLQSLTTIGTPIAWLFAKPENSDSKNGFTATGGKFNYTAEVRFPKSGDIARIFMTFSGLDVFDNLKVTVRLEGTVPKLSRGGTIMKGEVVAYDPAYKVVIISMSHFYGGFNLSYKFTLEG